MKVEINVADYVGQDELKELARAAASAHFKQQLESNIPYYVLYEAIKNEGFSFRDVIAKKIEQIDLEPNTYVVTSSQEFKKAMAEVLKEHQEKLCEILLKKLDMLDFDDLQSYLTEAIIGLVKKGAK